MEEFRLRRSNRIANIRDSTGSSGDSTGSSGDRPLPSRIAISKMKVKRVPKKRMTIKDNDGDSKSIAVNESESQSPPQTKTKKKKKKDGRVRAPRPRNSPYDYNLTQTEIRQQCALALAMFNKNNGPRYVLVKALRCYLTAFPLLFHCNFIARPKYSSSADENRLFFGELKYVGHVSKPGVLTCTVCCIVGDVGTATGPQGCKFCKCEHPVGIEFRKSHREAVDLAELTGFHYHQNNWI